MVETKRDSVWEFEVIKTIECIPSQNSFVHTLSCVMLEPGSLERAVIKDTAVQ